MALQTFDPSRATDEEKELKPNSVTVHNPLIAMVGITKYEAGTANVDLPGVNQDMAKSSALWCDYLKYDMNVLTDTQNAEHQINLADAQNFFTRMQMELVENTANYDSLIVILSGHGYGDALITADDHQYKVNAVRDMFNGEQLKSFRENPRIFLIDLCRGDKIAKPIRVSDEEGDERWKGSRLVHPDSNGIVMYSNTQDYQVADAGIMMPVLLEVFEKTRLEQQDLARIHCMVAQKVEHNSGGLQCVEYVSTIKRLIYFRARENMTGTVRQWYDTVKQAGTVESVRTGAVFVYYRNMRKYINAHWNQMLLIGVGLSAGCTGLLIGANLYNDKPYQIPGAVLKLNAVIFYVFNSLIETAKAIWNAQREHGGSVQS